MASKTILVIEDSDIQREGLAYILREAGYNVLTAKDGRDGLSWMRCEPKPDLILLDMMVRQGMDGWQFLAERKHDSQLAAVPVIITTGLGNASDEWASALGACALIHKPVETEQVLAAVNKCL